MTSKRVTRYYADCGRGFWKKDRCLQHEHRCKCWTNPKFRTCMTCKHGDKMQDSNGMEAEPYFLQTWYYWQCHNIDFDYQKHFKAAHEKAETLCINCPIWESK